MPPCYGRTAAGDRHSEEGRNNALEAASSRGVVAAAAFAVAVTAPAMFAGHATDGVDAKVTDDNNNVDGGLANVTPSKDAQNRQANETTVSISPRPSPVTGGVGDLVAAGGTTTGWFPTRPMSGSATCRSTAARPGSALRRSRTASIRWSRAFRRTRRPRGRHRRSRASMPPATQLCASARTATCISPRSASIAIRPARPAARHGRLRGEVRLHGRHGGDCSSPTSAGSPPHFTYAGTTVVDRGAVGFAVPGVAGFVGTFTDKEWMEVDGNAPVGSPCAGNVYVAHTNFHALVRNAPIVFSSSTDGGRLVLASADDLDRRPVRHAE